MTKAKISIVGAGNVGASLCYELVLSSLCKEIVLFDIFENVASGKVLDIYQACLLDKPDLLIKASSSYEDVADSDIVVITAGSPRKQGQSRDDLLFKNAVITKNIAKNIAIFAPNAIIIEVANPLDAMTYVAFKQSGFLRSKVLGMAGLLDGMRMVYHIQKSLDFVPKSIKPVLIGSHNDKMLPLVRFTTVDEKPLSEYMNRQSIEEVVSKTRQGGSEIVSLLNTSAYYAPAHAVAIMIKAILQDTKEVLPCSVFLDGEYDYAELVCGVMVSLGKNGVESIEELDLNESEKASFDESIKSVKELLRKLKV